ncbi:MAG: glycerol-3-phosphate 1-O-acyltransferase PlsY [candidate division KSB1 bacterium]|nr:glycerol-3-phosphate 1-O-acyltransferase PlsY [candidate division KSB1 bacterium]
MNLLVIALAGYLLGSIPTAIIVSKVFHGIDIREHGSGNAGATNVFRVLGWKSALLVMLVDVGKGLVATLYASQLVFAPVMVEPVYLKLLAGLAAVFGHIWTIFGGFRGGKGVGTAAGMLLALYPIAVLICLGIFVIVVYTTRYVSLGSITAAVSLPIVLLIMKQGFHKFVEPELMAFSVFIAVLIVFTHRSNIRRLISGTENRFGQNTAKSS